jgi:hypothetical protein
MVRYGKLEAEDPTWLFVLVKVNHLLLTVNSAGNIVIYSLKVKRHHEKKNQWNGKQMSVVSTIFGCLPNVFHTIYVYNVPTKFSNENLMFHII